MKACQPIRELRRASGAWLAGATLLSLIAAASHPAAGTVIVRFEPAASVVGVGGTVLVDVVADFTDPIVAFGFDIDVVPALLSVSSTPVIGPGWIGVAAPDGDGLAGLIDSGPIVGPDVLLATVELTGLAPGVAMLLGSVTPGDLTEGFGLSTPGAFDELEFRAASITVPETSAIALVGAGLLLLRGLRRRAS